MNASIPNWLIEEEKKPHALLSSFNTVNVIREQYKKIFLQKGIPDHREERFKYTNFNVLTNQQFSLALRPNEQTVRHAIHDHRLKNTNSILLVFVNGYFMPQFSDLHKLPVESIIMSLSDAGLDHLDQSEYSSLIAKHWPDHLDEMKYQQYPFAALSAATFIDGLFFVLPDDCEIPLPIHLLSIGLGSQEFYAHPHHIFNLGKNSKLTLVEEYLSLSEKAYWMNILLTITLEENAHLDHYKIQMEHQDVIHMAHTFIQQKQNSQVSMMHFANGAKFARDDILIVLQETGASCKTSGYYQLNADDQYIDHHIDIQHVAPHSQSEMLYKGVLNNKSRAVFNGRVQVLQNAQKILAHQANHNLLLSKQAEVYSKPDLEIYADDVKCKHGATVGELDHEALFYLRSRGIEKQEAIDILLQGFSEEILARISHPAIRDHIEEKCVC